MPPPTRAHADLVDRFLAPLPESTKGMRWLVTRETYEQEEPGFFDEALGEAERLRVVVVHWRVASGGALVSLAARECEQGASESMGTLMHPEVEPDDRTES